MLPKIEKDSLLSAWEPDYFCFQILSVDRDKSNCGEVGRGGSHPKCVQLLTRGGGVTLHLYMRNYTIFSCSWQHGCLMLFCIICRNFILPSFK